MKNKNIKLTALFRFFMSLFSCDNNADQKTNRSDLDLIMRNQVTVLLQNQSGLFTARSNSSAIREGGPMGFWFYPPWIYYGVSAGGGGADESVVTYTDTSYYDSASGCWVYQYTDSSYDSRVFYHV